MSCERASAIALGGGGVGARAAAADATGGTMVGIVVSITTLCRPSVGGANANDHLVHGAVIALVLLRARQVPIGKEQHSQQRCADNDEVSKHKHGTALQSQQDAIRQVP
jgi:hypothetical protein